MFAKTIVDSDAFLDMPTSTQCLYFHLSIRADDDGFINNPKKIVRIVNCSEDDLKLLIGKKFIIPFESGIVVIKHWRIHNYIQSDRYKPTVYQEEKQLLGIKKNGAYTIKNQPEITTDTECIQNVSKMEAQVRLGKDRLDEVRQEVEEEEKNPHTPHEEIKELYNNICKSLTPIRSLSDSRKEKIRTRWKQLDFNIDNFKKVFEIVEGSSFCTGNNNRGWKADFDWIMKNDDNIIKILEGKYGGNEYDNVEENNNKPKTSGYEGRGY